MRFSLNNSTLLDCTLRDGGYYNNWNFEIKLINSYLKTISKTPIKFIELGFVNFDKNNNLISTANVNTKLLNKIIIPESLKLGVMINFSDISIESEKISRILSKFKDKKFKSKIKFVRLATHLNEIYKIRETVKFLKKHKYIVTVNIMQISELKISSIKKLSSFLYSLKVDIVYLADSLGCLNKKTISKLSKTFKKYFNGNLGIHAHNNLNLALSNSYHAYKNGFNWIDSTIMGMGRGPGNVLTEEILSKLYPRELKTGINSLKHFINKDFSKLKKIYKWGPNKFYRYAAKKKIHPTYIQEILSDKRYNPSEYFKILNNLDNIDAKKFNPNKLILSSNFYKGTPKSKWSPLSILKDKNILIIGPGNSVAKNKIKIENFIEKNKLFVIALNTSKGIDEKYINLRLVSHPLRIISDIHFHNKISTNLILPLSMLPEELKEKINRSNKILFDYGLTLKNKNNLKIKNNYCELPNSLAISYALSILVAGKTNYTFIAGLDGSKKNDSAFEETKKIFDLFKKRYKNFDVKTITKTKFKLKSFKI